MDEGDEKRENERVSPCFPFEMRPMSSPRMNKLLLVRTQIKIDLEILVSDKRQRYCLVDISGTH